jgi:hypothetical protein
MFRWVVNTFITKTEVITLEDRTGHVITGASDHLKAAFTEVDVYLTNDLAAKIGTRVEHSSLINKANLAPRVSMAYKAGQTARCHLPMASFTRNRITAFLHVLTAIRTCSIQEQPII